MTTYWIVSYYGDGDGVVEGVLGTRANAEIAVEHLRWLRDDQDEMPRIEIEERS